MKQGTREFSFTRDDFNFLRHLANERTGIVVTDDKFDMFYSRLSRRVRSLGLDSFSQYCDLLRREKADKEVFELINAITTNLTAFFRENHHFEYLSTTVIPDLLQRNAASRKISIWSAGCSTGEEPYSISITLNESLPSGWNANILATDIDSNVLRTAAQGVYSHERITGIQNHRLKRWFQRGKGSHEGLVRLKQEVRRLTEFRQLNLMEQWRLDEPVDFIFCRNVIIYFDSQTKAKLVNRYADALKEGGYLFIGHSESLHKLTDRYRLIGNTIYQKTV